MNIVDKQPYNKLIQIISNEKEEKDKQSIVCC